MTTITKTNFLITNIVIFLNRICVDLDHGWQARPGLVALAWQAVAEVEERGRVGMRMYGCVHVCVCLKRERGRGTGEHCLALYVDTYIAFLS